MAKVSLVDTIISVCAPWSAVYNKTMNIMRYRLTYVTRRYGINSFRNAAPGVTTVRWQTPIAGESA